MLTNILNTPLTSQSVLTIDTPRSKSLLTRLRDCSLQLIAPSWQTAQAHFSRLHLDRELSGRINSQVSRLRSAVIPDLALSYSGSELIHQDLDWDWASWHIVAIDNNTKDVLGCISMRLYSTKVSKQPEQILNYANIDVENRTTKATLMQGIECFTEDLANSRKKIYQVGGFAVKEKAQGTVLGPLLGLSINACIQLLHLSRGLTIATHDRHVAGMDLKLGAQPLAINGVALPTFQCARHGTLCQLLIVDPTLTPERLQPTILDLLDYFSTRPVLIAK